MQEFSARWQHGVCLRRLINILGAASDTSFLLITDRISLIFNAVYGFPEERRFLIAGYESTYFSNIIPNMLLNFACDEY